MTNEIIQAIKAEIERRIKELDEQIVDIYDSKAVLRKDELQKLLSFLSTLESEKPNQDELEKEIEEYFPESTFNTGFNYDDMQEIARHFYELGKRSGSSEKPSEGLEEELDKWRHEHFHGKRDDHFSGEYLERTSQLDLARHFAQWQREQDEKEEADLFTIVALDAAQRAKEQMMKEAVEYEVWDFSSSLEAYPHVNIPLDNKQYRSGDKVRVIVLPKEDGK